jgi:carbon-monoxide dehydrogenase small subunit
MKVKLTLDGRPVEYDAHPGEILIECLRRHGCFSVKRGCQDGNCGTCLVQVDGEVVNSCLVLVAQAGGTTVTTAAGIGSLENPHPIQKAFVENAATQCGFCTPGLVVSIKSLLDRNPDPTEAEVKEAIDGNICRCTGYTKIFDAIQDVIKATQEAA